MSMRLSLILAAALAAQGCTVALPVTLGTSAHLHNRSLDRAEARPARESFTAADPAPSYRYDRPAERKSVGARVAGGVVGGLMIDVALMAILTSVVIDHDDGIEGQAARRR